MFVFNTCMNNVSFTSVMPLKVFINGKFSAEEADILRATKQLTAVLKGPCGKSPEKLDIIREFAKHDRDYSYERGFLGYKGSTSEFFRRSDSYFFTGPQAAALDNFGKRIGPAKKEGNNNFTALYFSKMRNFIDAPLLRVREFLNKETRQYEGEPVSLNIYTTSSGKSGLVLKNIKFEK